MSYLLSLTSRFKKTSVPEPRVIPVVEPVEVEVVPEPVLPVSEPVEVEVVPEPVLPVSEPVEVDVVEVPFVAVEETPIEAPSEEQCASPPAPASTASSHTEESC